MMEKERTYVAIDLKSFYASVECKERNRDPLTTNLVVADKSRNAVLKGMNLQKGATAKDRNEQIGGHKA